MYLLKGGGRATFVAAMSDAAAIAMAMREVTNGGLQERTHRIGWKLYPQTLTGKEIMRWILVVKKLAYDEGDAEHKAQALLSQGYIERIEEQVTALRVASGDVKHVERMDKLERLKMSMLPTAEDQSATHHFDPSPKALYVYTDKGFGLSVNSDGDQGSKETRAGPTRFDAKEAAKAGVTLLSIGDSENDSVVASRRREEMSYLKHGPTPFQRARHLKFEREDIEVPAYVPIFTHQDGRVYRVKENEIDAQRKEQLHMERQLKHYHSQPQYKFLGDRSNERRVMTVQDYVFHPSRESSEIHPGFLSYVKIPKANQAASTRVLAFVMKEESYNSRQHQLLEKETSGKAKED